ncbi:MAG: putative transrane protein [Proteobacteria bacterium]|nr:putative transrane protein [Pseudomonadota bacterium]
MPGTCKIMSWHARPLARTPLLGGLVVFCMACFSLAMAQPDSEPQLESAYLVNFLKYVEWPASSRNTSTICLFGRDTLGPYLSNHEGRLVGGKELRIRRVKSPDDMGACQLLYIPDIEEARISAVLRWIQGMPILPASNADGFARAGGGIELLRNGGRVQFIVNADTLSRHGLTPSSQMMRLASRVIGGER